MILFQDFKGITLIYEALLKVGTRLIGRGGGQLSLLPLNGTPANNITYCCVSALHREKLQAILHELHVVIFLCWSNRTAEKQSCITAFLFSKVLHWTPNSVMQLCLAALQFILVLPIHRLIYLDERRRGLGNSYRIKGCCGGQNKIGHIWLFKECTNIIAEVNANKNLVFLEKLENYHRMS